MFDGGRGGGDDDDGWTGEAVSEDMARLCARFDGLLEPDGPALDAAGLDELRGLAGIYDLAGDDAPAEIWRALRAMLTRQTGAEALPDAGPMTILLVEDDPAVAGDLLDVLAGAGHAVVGPFSTAETAAAGAALTRVDVALLDINLAGEGTGVELAAILKARFGLPSVFISGDVSAAARHADLAEAIVTKPFTGRDILGALARVAAKA